MAMIITIIRAVVMRVEFDFFAGLFVGIIRGLFAGSI